jgi:hypothetical protein
MYSDLPLSIRASLPTSLTFLSHFQRFCIIGGDSEVAIARLAIHGWIYTILAVLYNNNNISYTVELTS